MIESFLAPDNFYSRLLPQAKVQIVKLIAQCFFSGCLMLLTTVPASSQTLWYSGDATGPSTYSNSVYQDFIIPAQVPVGK